MTRPSVLCADGQRRHPAQDYATISPEDVAELLDDPPASPCGPHTVVSGSSAWPADYADYSQADYDLDQRDEQ